MAAVAVAAGQRQRGAVGEAVRSPVVGGVGCGGKAARKAAATVWGSVTEPLVLPKDGRNQNVSASYCPKLKRK